MPAITQECITRVIENSDIVKIVSRYTSLTQKGGRFWGLCPFPDHNEKTASFSVKADDGFYYCFGCEKGGNVVGFVMEMNRFTFVEAIEYLAEEAGIPLEYEASSGNYPDRQKNSYTEKKTLYEINRRAANWYYSNLMKNPSALKYLSDRGITSRAVKNFGLGYSPRNGGLYEYLLGQGFQKEDILAVSLARENEKGVYDYFRDRIMYPILDVNGNIVGFGGRVTEKKEPKYLNSPENSVFLKRSMLYNLNRAKDVLKNNSPVIIVEGYMDVISLYDKGIKAVCATLGTALGEKHARIIKRYTDNVILCYDGDAPGRNAAVRGSVILENEGLNVKVLMLPGDHDPDSYIREYGTEEFVKRVGEASFATDFRLDELKAKYDLTDLNDRARFLGEAASAVSEVRDEVKWDHYSRRLASWTGTDTETVRGLIYAAAGKAGLKEGDTEKAAAAAVYAADSGRSNSTELRVLAYIASDPDHYRNYTACGGGNFFTGSLAELYTEVERIYAADPETSALKRLLTSEKLSGSAALLSATDPGIGEEDLSFYVDALIGNMYAERLREIKRQIESDIPDSEKMMLLQEQTFLKKKLNGLKSGN